MNYAEFLAFFANWKAFQQKKFKNSNLINSRINLTWVRTLELLNQKHRVTAKKADFGA